MSRANRCDIAAASTAAEAACSCSCFCLTGQIVEVTSIMGRRTESMYREVFDTFAVLTVLTRCSACEAMGTSAALVCSRIIFQ